MPNNTSASKRDRINKQRNMANRAERSKLNTLIKKYHSAIAIKDKLLIDTSYNDVIKAIDQAAAKGIIHGNKRNRLKSKITIIYNVEFNSFDDNDKSIADNDSGGYGSSDGNKGFDDNMDEMNEKSTVFISYSHNDAKYVDELELYLKSLKRIVNFEYWNDSKIKSGEKWKDMIEGSLNNASIVVLMVSVSFFASDFIWENEYKPILDNAKNNGLEILWVYVSPVDYEIYGIGEYQAVKNKKFRDFRPLSSMNRNSRNEVYMAIGKRIREILSL